MAKHFGVNCQGEFLMEKRTNIPTWDASQEGRLFYNISNATPYFGGPSQFESFRAVADAVPAGEIILFEKDTSVVGYNLQSDVDDEVVYISKGSGNGGETGGTSIGDWTTLTNHTHDTGDFTLTEDEIPSHNHGGGNHTHSVPEGTVAGGGTIFASGDDKSNSADTNSTSGASGTIITSYGGGDPHNHGATDPSSGISSWRPKSRVFTRQQRI